MNPTAADLFFQSRAHECMQVALCVFQDAGLIAEEPTPKMINAAARMKMAMMRVLQGESADVALEKVPT